MAYKKSNARKTKTKRRLTRGGNQVKKRTPKKSCRSKVSRKKPTPASMKKRRKRR